MRSTTSWLLLVLLLLLLGWVVAPPIVRRISYSVTRGQTQAWREQLATMPAGDPMSGLFVQVARTVEPAVVEVQVIRRVATGQPADPHEFVRRFFGDGPGWAQPAPREQIQQGIGSGFIVDDRNGYILTNYHVVAQADLVQVVLADGRTVQTAWIRGDAPTDLALIKVDARDLIATPLGDSDAMRVGEWVLAIGAPQGLQKTVTAGIISATGRYAGDRESYQDFLQTDAAINPGNSGGPLVNLRGEVVGINTAIVSPTGAYAGIGFAIPSNMVRPVMAQLIEQGTVTRGHLGVSLQQVTPELARSFGLPSTQGALVTEVLPDSPAAAAGLQSGDFITAIGNEKIDNPNDLRNTIAAVPPARTVRVEFYRDGRRQSAEVTVAAQPGDRQAAAQPAQAGPAAQLGLQVETMTPQIARQLGYRRVPQAVVITAIAPGSPADQAGLTPGLAIIAVGTAAVSTPEEFEQALAQQVGARGIRLRILDPSGRSRFVFLSPGQ